MKEHQDVLGLRYSLNLILQNEFSLNIFKCFNESGPGFFYYFHQMRTLIVMLPRLASDTHLSVSVPQAAKIAGIPQCVQLIRVPQLTRWDSTQNVFRGQARRITEEVILASTGQGRRANSGGQ